jgi:hypothetical protein
VAYFGQYPRGWSQNPRAQGNNVRAAHVDRVEDAHMDRIALVAWCWFLLWAGLGYAVGALAFAMPRTGALSGFWVALAAIFAWPWIMPEAVNDWMDGPRERS